MTVESRQSRPASEEKVEAARAWIRKALREGPAVVAYSGGKDGNSAAELARDCGINDGVCEESFYFDAQRADVRASAARHGHKVTYCDSLTYEWLSTRQRMCFPHRD